MMDEKIKEIQDYFRNKIVSGEYVEVIRDSYKTWLRIDGKYNFILWISNGCENIHFTYTFDDNTSEINSFMMFDLSPYEKKKIWENINKLITEEEKKRAEERELREYKRLKKKFEKANKDEKG